MKKRIFPMILLSAGLLLALAGCEKQQTKNPTADNPAPPAQLKVVPSESSLDGMTAYSSCSFVFDDSEWTLQLFVQEDMLADGELMMDDRGHYLVQAVSGENSYVLFDDTVQLGMPEADVWTDAQENLHIVLRDVRSAKYSVTDFVYYSQAAEFVGSVVLDGEGINYMGTTAK